MLYLANPTGVAKQAMIDGVLGFINTPMQGNKLIPGVRWCADNSCFGKNYPGDAKWFSWLASLVEHKDNCLFATAPDVVGDAEATMERSLPWLRKIRELGFKPALVAQDGLEYLDVPWDEFDCLFIGGSTEWKLGEAARLLCLEAKRRGKWVHCGRVNSNRRFRYAALEMKADSCDGTYLVFGPKKNLPKLLSWIDGLAVEQLNLFDF